MNVARRKAAKFRRESEQRRNPDILARDPARFWAVQSDRRLEHSRRHGAVVPRHPPHPLGYPPEWDWDSDSDDRGTFDWPGLDDVSDDDSDDEALATAARTAYMSARALEDHDRCSQATDGRKPEEDDDRYSQATDVDNGKIKKEAVKDVYRIGSEGWAEKQTRMDASGMFVISLTPKTVWYIYELGNFVDGDLIEWLGFGDGVEAISLVLYARLSGKQIKVRGYEISSEAVEIARARLRGVARRYGDWILDCVKLRNRNVNDLVPADLPEYTHVYTTAPDCAVTRKWAELAVHKQSARQLIGFTTHFGSRILKEIKDSVTRAQNMQYVRSQETRTLVFATLNPEVRAAVAEEFELS